MAEGGCWRRGRSRFLLGQPLQYQGSNVRNLEEVELVKNHQKRKNTDDETAKKFGENISEMGTNRSGFGEESLSCLLFACAEPNCMLQFY